MKRCQSCGMPLANDLGGGGTEEDGSKSETYCSLCYKDGKFIGEDCTVQEMQEIVERALKRQGHGWRMRKLARWQIPRLARWKQKK
jgi:Putative zinc ribbon domain